MIDESNIFRFAKKVASFYCSKYNNWDQYDDAVQEVCIHLLENRSHLEKSEKILYRQEFLRLVLLWLSSLFETTSCLYRPVLVLSDVQSKAEILSDLRLSSRFVPFLCSCLSLRCFFLRTVPLLQGSSQWLQQVDVRLRKSLAVVRCVQHG